MKHEQLRRRLMKLLAGFALLLAACEEEPPADAPSPTPAMQTIQGTLGPSFTDCDDLPHAQVVVTDEAGDIIGTTTASGDTNGLGNGCLIEFSVPVPEAEFYTLKIGTHEGPTYSRAELDEADWNVSLSLS